MSGHSEIPKSSPGSPAKSRCLFADISILLFGGACLAFLLAILCQPSGLSIIFGACGLGLLLLSFIAAYVTAFRILIYPRTCKGLPLVIVPLVIPIILLISIPYIQKAAAVPKTASYLHCIGIHLILYTQDHNDSLPPANEWCDALVPYTNGASFNTPLSDAHEGESSFAMNRYVDGFKLSAIDANVVLLFETDAGKDPNLKFPFSRDYRDFKETEVNGIRTITRGPHLAKYRWNQCGGPKILTTAHNKGKGAYILFGQGNVEFVKTKDLPGLRWKP